MLSLTGSEEPSYIKGLSLRPNSTRADFVTRRRSEPNSGQKSADWNKEPPQLSSSDITTRKRSRRPAGETERAFIEAATALFAEKGYNGTSIHDLSERLGLTTASLYYHMSGKEDLLFRVLQTGMTGFLDRLDTVVASNRDPADQLVLAVTNHIDMVLDNPTQVAVFLRERRFLPTRLQKDYNVLVHRYDKQFNLLIENAMKAGDIPRRDASLLRLCALGMINWAFEWYRNGRMSKAEIRAEMLDLALVGIFGFDQRNVQVLLAKKTAYSAGSRQPARKTALGAS